MALNFSRENYNLFNGITQLIIKEDNDMFNTITNSIVDRFYSLPKFGRALLMIGLAVLVIIINT